MAEFDNPYKAYDPEKVKNEPDFFDKKAGKRETNIDNTLTGEKCVLWRILSKPSER